MVAIREAFVWPATVGLRREVRVRVRMRSLVKIGFGRFNGWRVGVEIARVRRDDVEQQTMNEYRHKRRCRCILAHVLVLCL